MPECWFESGAGGELPQAFDTRDPEAVQGTRVLSGLEPPLIVGRDRRPGLNTSGALLIAAPSLNARGWMPLMYVRDDRGRFQKQRVAWYAIRAALKAAREDPRDAATQAAEHNAALDAQREQEFDDLSTEACRFVERAVVGEMEGHGRHSSDDVAVALKRALDGSNPGPKGQIISVARQPHV